MSVCLGSDPQIQSSGASPGVCKWRQGLPFPSSFPFGPWPGNWGFSRSALLHTVCDCVMSRANGQMTKRRKATRVYSTFLRSQLLQIEGKIPLLLDCQHLWVLQHCCFHGCWGFVGKPECERTEKSKRGQVEGAARSLWIFGEPPFHAPRQNWRVSSGVLSALWSPLLVFGLPASRPVCTRGKRAAHRQGEDVEFWSPSPACQLLLTFQTSNEFCLGVWSHIWWDL